MQPQIAIVNSSKRLTDDFVAHAAKACDLQVIEAAQAWGVDPTPVAWYARAAGLPEINCRIMELVDDIDAPGALGYHDDVAGVIYGRVLVQDEPATSTTLSHECLEEMLDPTCDQWRAMPGARGRATALEVCDAVEAETYAIGVSIMGGTPRQITLSDYLLPRWFDAAAPGNFDRLARLSAPFTMTEGGYMIVRDGAGNETNVFALANPGDLKAQLAIARKMMRPRSRAKVRLGMPLPLRTAA